MIKGLDIQLPGKEAGLRQCDLHLTMRPAGESISGDIRFSAGEIALQGISSVNVSGAGKFDDRNFSMEISRSQTFGGQLKFLAYGKTSGGPFPLKSSFAAEEIDLAAISKAVSKRVKLPYRIEGGLKRAAFDGILQSQDSLTGHASLEAGKVSVLRIEDGRNIVKEGLFHGEMDFSGKDLTFKAEAAAGPVSTRLSGAVKGVMMDDRQLEVRTSLFRCQGGGSQGNFLGDLSGQSPLYEAGRVTLFGGIGELRQRRMEGERNSWPSSIFTSREKTASTGWDPSMALSRSSTERSRRADRYGIFPYSKNPNSKTWSGSTHRNLQRRTFTE